MKKTAWRLTAAALATAALLALFLFLEYGSYPAALEAVAAMASGDAVTVTREGRMTVFSPEDPQRGFIFYPGGRVDERAYAPLMRALSQEGWLCVLLGMPFDLAVLDMDAAKGVAQRFPQIGTWAIGGHSLGGAMAASHAARNPGAYDALVLLAAYAADDLTGSGMQVISLYGENDGVLNGEKYAQYRKNLPADALEIVIPGGNHALFGDYGAQKGDGEAAISAQEQIDAVVGAMRGIE